MVRIELSTLQSLENAHLLVLLPDLLKAAHATAKSKVDDARFKKIDTAWKWKKKIYKPTEAGFHDARSTLAMLCGCEEKHINGQLAKLGVSDPISLGNNDREATRTCAFAIHAISSMLAGHAFLNSKDFGLAFKKGALAAGATILTTPHTKRKAKKSLFNEKTDVAAGGGGGSAFTTPVGKKARTGGKSPKTPSSKAPFSPHFALSPPPLSAKEAKAQEFEDMKAQLAETAKTMAKLEAQLATKNAAAAKPATVDREDRMLNILEKFGTITSKSSSAGDDGAAPPSSAMTAQYAENRRRLDDDGAVDAQGCWDANHASHGMDTPHAFPPAHKVYKEIAKGNFYLNLGVVAVSTGLEDTGIFVHGTSGSRVELESASKTKASKVKVSWELWLHLMARFKETIKVAGSFTAGTVFQRHIDYVKKLRRQFKSSRPEGWRLYDSTVRAQYTADMSRYDPTALVWPNWKPNAPVFQQIFHACQMVTCLQCGDTTHDTATCLSNGGAAPRADPPPTRTTPKGGDEMQHKTCCRAFNSGSPCRYEAQDGGCKAGHTCSTCGSSDHGASTCTKRRGKIKIGF